MKIYLAASVTYAEETAAIAEDIRNIGHEVTSHWHDSVPLGGFLGSEEIENYQAKSQSGAFMDMSGILDADLIVVFTKKTSTTGGMHVEFGIAIGLEKKIVVVGRRVNVFMMIPSVRNVANEAEFLDLMKDWRSLFSAPAQTAKD